MPYATAADLPGEVIHLILECIVRRHDVSAGSTYMARPHSPLSPTELCVCSLVCREWAKRFRPVVFEHIPLRSRAQLDRLFTLLDSRPVASPLIRECARTMSLEMAGEWTSPWIHRASTLALNLGLEIYVTLSSIYVASPDFPDNRFAPKSLSTCLPRSLPASLYRTISQLILNDLHFEDAWNFILLVADLPAVVALECHRVTFGEIVWPPSVSARKFSVSGLEFFECKGTALAAEACRLAVCRREQLVRRMPFEMCHVMTQALFTLIPIDDHYLYLSPAGLQNDDLWITLRTNIGRIQCGIHVTGASQNPTFHVSFVVPLYLSSFSPESVRQLGWGMFEDAVAGLDPAPRLDILTHQEDVFKSIISGLADGTILSSPSGFRQGSVVIHLVHANIFFDDRILSTDVFSMGDQFRIGDHLVKLSPLDCVQYLLLQGNLELQNAFLRDVVDRDHDIAVAVA